MSEGDRRAPGATRIPFEAMVEVGGATGPAFEAQAVDVSLEGMHLRTAYLPEVGQPLTCRFDAGSRETVLASGEVVWSREAARGGEFGIRFSGLDGNSARILSRMTCDAPSESAPPRGGQGMKVRLHIDGLGSPMRARVKGVNQAELTVGSELGFLQVGKALELENAETGSKRAARIDRVEVQVDPESQVPELVVALRYSDDEFVSPDAPNMASAPTMRHEAPERADEPPRRDERLHHADERLHVDERLHADERPRMDERRDAMDSADTAPMGSGAHASDGVDVDVDDESEATRTAADRMKGAFSRGAAKVTPTINAFAQRAKTTFALLAARRWRDKGEVRDDVAIPMRRVTAPPPGGGLHAEGRKVVRDFATARDGLGEKGPVFALDKKKMIVGGIAGALLIVGAVAMRKPSAPPPAAATAASEAPIGSAAALADNAGAPAGGASAAAAPNAANTQLAAAAPPPAPAVGAVAEPSRGASESLEGTSAPREERRAPRHVAVVPFSNGAVSHGNVLRLKMDGAIDKIQGAAQSTGFTVVIPSRRSLEAAAPLASRDGRIASIKVVNDPGGAELAVTFKDGVPNYLVRAKGEVLEIVLAPAGRITERQVLADGAHDGHDGPRAHATPGANAKRKHPAPRHQ